MNVQPTAIQHRVRRTPTGRFWIQDQWATLADVDSPVKTRYYRFEGEAQDACDEMNYPES